MSREGKETIKAPLYCGLIIEMLKLDVKLFGLAIELYLAIAGFLLISGLYYFYEIKWLKKRTSVYLCFIMSRVSNLTEFL